MKKLFLAISLTFSFTIAFSQGPGCPSIQISSYQGTGLPAITLPCDSSCVNLTANVFAIQQTTSYTVSSIPYSGLPYPATGGINFNNEDIWSSVINIPFNFCYFGNVFNQLIVSPNGAVSFNIGPANQYHSWSFPATQQVPTLGGAFTGNTIFGAMHDMNSECSGGSVNYSVQGVFPCRAFVLSFNNVPHYKSANWPWQNNCSSLRTTQQIVLYEGTNAIEVYIQNKPAETSWNGGRAVIGIQNAAGDVGYAPPGRNTGVWSASNEAWRFSASGAPSYQITWHEGNITNPAVATGPTLTACPSTQFTSYSALLTYTNCANQSNQFWSSIDVTLSGPATPVFTSNAPVCETQTLTFNAPTVAGATYFWTGPGGWTSSVEDPTRPGATAAMSGQYNLYVVVAGCTSAVASQNVLVIGAASTPTFTTNSPVCSGDQILLNTQAQPGATYHWTGPNGFTSTSQNPTITGATAAAAGTYNLYITLSGCTSGTASQSVVVNPTPSAPAFTSNSPVCTLDDIVFDGPNIPSATYSWAGPGGWTSALEDPTRPNASLGMAGTYTLNVTVNGCTSPAATQNVVVNGPDNPVFNVNSPICGGDSIIFDATPIAGATYFWSGPNGFNPGNLEDPFIVSATAAMTGTYNLYVVVNGCTSLTESKYVEVIPIVTPPTAANTPLCVGDTLFLSSVPNSPLISYHWYGPNGWEDSTTATPFIASATTGMSGQYYLIAGAMGCVSDTGFITVTVNPIPATPNFTTNSPICEGSDLVLDGPTSSIATYHWSGPNSFTSSQENDTIVGAGLAAGGTYSLYITELGCTSATATGNVVVNDVFDVVPNVVPTNPCQGSVVNFDATVTVQPPSVILGSGWDVNGDGVPDYTTTQATHVYTTAGNYTATFAVLGTGNCTTVVNVPIVVNPKPTITYTGPTQNCGVSVALTSNGQVQTPGTISNYTWYLTSGTSIGTGQNITYPFAANPSQQVTGYVVTTTTDGCADTAIYSILLHPTPQAGFDVDECIGMTVPFDNTSNWVGTPAAGTTMSYNWNFGDGQTGTAEDPTHTYQAPGSYDVTLITTSSAFACADTVETQIVVSAEPDVQIVATPQCFQNVDFSSVINAYGSNINQFDWDLGNGSSMSDSVFTYEYQNAGAYNVILTVTNAENCSTTVNASVTVLPSVTLSSLVIPNIITPNGDGANDELVLDNQFETCIDYQMQIFNRWGVLVYKQIMGSVPFRGQNMSGGRLATGVYFYTIKAGNTEKNGTITIAY